MIVIALRQLHVTKPGEPIEVTEAEGRMLVHIGYAKLPDPEAHPQAITQTTATLDAPQVPPPPRRRARRSAPPTIEPES